MLHPVLPPAWPRFASIPPAAARVARLVVLLIFFGAAPSSGAPPSEPESLVRWFGDASSATGAAVAHGACDVDDDGFADVIAGAWFWDKAGVANNTGAVYVLRGGPDVAGGDLSNPAQARAIRIEGPPVANRFLGFSVGCAGDVNGDGIDDLLIGDYVAEQAWIVFGSSTFGPLDLGALGTAGYRVHLDDADASWNLGYAVTGVGDVNGDGLGDVAIAAVVADTVGRTNNGRIFVLPGKADASDVVLPTDPSAATPALLVLDGSSSEERLGQIARAGDVDGDHVPDLVVGSYTATPHGAAVAVPGAAWVISGTARGAVDLASPGDLGFAVWGPERGRDRLGIAVAAAGDQNGDGFDDVLLGGDGVYNAATGRRPGSAWVVYGGAGIFTALDVVRTDATPGASPAVYSLEPGAGAGGADVKQPRGRWIAGPVTHTGTSGEAFGYALDSTPDLDGDGVPELLIGAYGHRTGDAAAPVNTGAVWVLHGRGGTETLDLSAATPADGYRIDGLASGDRFGRQVAGVGDVDGNGVPDFAVGADFAARPLGDPAPRTQAGEVTLALLHDPPGLPEPGDVIADAPGHATLALSCPEARYECNGDLELVAGSAWQLRSTFALARGAASEIAFVPGAELEAALARDGSAPGTLRLRGTGAHGAALDEVVPVTISRPGWKRFGLPVVTPAVTTMSVLGKVPVRLFCPQTYDRCRGEAQLKLGGEASTVRFALGSGESQVRKFAVPGAAHAKLARDGFLVGSVRTRALVGGTEATAKTRVVVRGAP